LRICVYGAGASGGHFAVRLAQAGHDVCVVARGAQLDAIRYQGLTLIAGDRQDCARVRASDDTMALGVQDLVLVTVKATALDAVAAFLRPLLAPHTLVAFPQNGMGWWYPHGLAADRPRPPDLPIFRLGTPFMAMMREGQVLGGSIYSANEVISPGVIRNTSPDRNGLTLGAIAPGRDGEVAALRAALQAAGLASPAVEDIRRTMWGKLLVNMSGSTLALATGCLSSVSRTDAALGEVYLRLVGEGLAIARAHGYALDDVDPGRLQAGLLDHKPSLLQDYEQRRPMEVAQIVLAPQQFARAQGVATPTLDAVAAIVCRLAHDRGLMQGPA
jgi:2-dehydropantoate 2-reductase